MAILKKGILLTTIGMIALLSSCQNNDPSYDPGPPQGAYTNFFTQDYAVSLKDWKVGTDDNSGMYFYYEFREPNLSQYIYDNGIMQAFLLVNNDNISPLPFNDYWIDNTGYMSTEQITCEFRPGYVTFIVKASDHNENIPPSYDEYDFRVRFAW